MAKGLDSNGLLYFGQQFLSNLRNIFAGKTSPTFDGTPTAPTAAAGTNNTQIATTAFVKTALDNYTPTITGPLVYKGSCTYANLPNNPAVGDMWDVTDAHGDYPAGTNYAWNGSAWDALGGQFSIEYMTNAEILQTINTIFA